MLNKLNEQSNVFLDIECLCKATITHFLVTIKELDKQLSDQKTTIVDLVEDLAREYNKANNKEANTWDLYNSSYLEQVEESKMYSVIFRRVENSIREVYLHKRKLSDEYVSSKKNVKKFEEGIGTLLIPIIEDFKSKIEKPTTEALIALNRMNVSRWKTRFSFLKSSFKIEKKATFIKAIEYLEQENQQNRNIEQIFYEASKFIAKYDKVLGLKYYAKYIYYDLNSTNFDNKPLTKANEKMLFSNDTQKAKFVQILSELIETKNIDNVLSLIDKFYLLERKKLKLDYKEIKEAEIKNDATVELLNTLFHEEDEEKSKANESINVVDTETNPVEFHNSIFVSEISMSSIQEKLIKIFKQNSFKLPQIDVERYATDNGFLKNQLIDSINDTCDEHLNGEVLIEEEGDSYIIEESYYEEIIK